MTRPKKNPAFFKLICTFQEADLESNPIKYSTFLVPIKIHVCTDYIKAKNSQRSNGKMQSHPMRSFSFLKTVFLKTVIKCCN